LAGGSTLWDRPATAKKVIGGVKPAEVAQKQQKIEIKKA
jgi:hypothetical protein